MSFPRAEVVTKLCFLWGWGFGFVGGVEEGEIGGFFVGGGGVCVFGFVWGFFSCLVWAFLKSKLHLLYKCSLTDTNLFSKSCLRNGTGGGGGKPTQ